MWKIKEWMSSHETLCALIALLLFYGAVDIVLGFAGKTYVKYRSNEYSYEIAIEEFERVCGEYMVLTENEYESEYYKFYDNKAEAINDFGIIPFYIVISYIFRGVLSPLYSLSMSYISIPPLLCENHAPNSQNKSFRFYLH